MPEHNEHLTIPYRYDVQGLRAVAIALVVLAHAGVPGFAGGFVGVDVFFVLSGYLISGLLVREHWSSGRIQYGRFLARRLRRLLPALLFVLATVLLAATLLLTTYEARLQSASFAFAATWTSNFFFAFSEFDYFAALSAKDLFLHTWSLGVEEQFYVLWPWLLILVFALTGTQARHDVSRRNLLYALSAVFIASLALCLYWSKVDPLLGFYMMPSRGWQFALGAGVFVVTAHDRNSHEGRAGMVDSVALNAFISLTGLVLIVGSAMLLQPNRTYPGFYALFPSVGTALLIYSGSAGPLLGVNRILAGKFFVWIGDRSYSLYLWHWPLLLLGAAYGLAEYITGTVAIVMLAVLLSACSYRYIEIPFWKGRFSRSTPSRVALVSLLMMLSTVGASQVLNTTLIDKSAVATQEGIYDPRNDFLAILKVGNGCDTWHFSAEVVPCSAGHSDARYTAVLIGDSIGAQWLPVLPEIYQEPEWQVVVLTKSACAIVDEEFYYERVGGLYDICTTWRNSALAYLEELRPDIIFVGSAAKREFTGSQWINGTKRILDRLTNASSQVVIIPATPALSFDGPSCIAQPNRFSLRLKNSDGECAETLGSSISDDIAARLEIAASKFANAHVLNLNDLVCPQQRCSARNEDGLTVFRDNQHLTKTFVLAQSAAVSDRLNAIGIGPLSFKSALASPPTP